MQPPHRKLVKHYHDPGDFHELTFSCYHQLPLLSNDVWRELFCRSVDRAIAGHNFRLAAFVLMPEHVHLLVYPLDPEPDIPGLLSGIKRPFSVQIKRILQDAKSPLLRKLTIRERPGVMMFRYWQEGPGYDRNLQTPEAVLAAIEYIHNNPVKRGLVARQTDWKWSSARHYLLDNHPVDPSLPTIHGLPADFLQ